jgi:hypothetical protein
MVLPLRIRMCKSLLVALALRGCLVALNADAPKVSVEVTVHQQNSAAAQDRAGSTLNPFALDARITDPETEFFLEPKRVDLFTNAENAYKEKPRKQNVFVKVTSEDTGKPVPIVLYELGTGGHAQAQYCILSLRFHFLKKSA